METPEQIVLLSEEAANQQFGVKPSVPKVHYRIGYQVGYEAALKTPWVDVYDHLPEGDEAVLVYNGLITEFCVFDGKNFYNSHSIEINHVRYWMYAPEPPKEDNTPILAMEDNPLYTGICTITGKEFTGHYRSVFGKDALFVIGTGIIYIKPGSLKELKGL